jgi:hypothetical protein
MIEMIKIIQIKNLDLITLNSNYFNKIFIIQQLFRRIKNMFFFKFIFMILCIYLFKNNFLLQLFLELKFFNI